MASPIRPRAPVTLAACLLAAGSATCQRDIAAVLSVHVQADRGAATREIVLDLDLPSHGRSEHVFAHDGEPFALAPPVVAVLTFRDGQAGTGWIDVRAADERGQRLRDCKAVEVLAGRANDVLVYLAADDGRCERPGGPPDGGSGGSGGGAGMGTGGAGGAGTGGTGGAGTGGGGAGRGGGGGGAGRGGGGAGRGGAGQGGAGAGGAGQGGAGEGGAGEGGAGEGGAGAGGGDECATSPACIECTGRSMCGWCASTGTCHTGTMVGPNVGSCMGWRWVSQDCSGSGGTGGGTGGTGGGGGGACDPTRGTADCPAGQACYFYSGGPICRSAGVAGQSQACVNQDDCAPGFGCAGPVGGNRRCEQACRTDQPGTCPSGTVCAPWPNQSTYGVCI